MDLRTVVTISTLLLMTVDQIDTNDNITTHGNSNSTDSSSTSAPTATAPPCANRSPTPALSLIIMRWTRKYHGEVHLIPNITSNSSSPVCYSEKTEVLTSLIRNICQSIGCKDVLRKSEGKNITGYHITEIGVMTETSCKPLTIQCTECPKCPKCPNKDVRGEEGQLRGYKVVTALLCFVLIVLLLMRFTRPTIKALQRRLSDRRQNRWIGPTQSHSVSYHRGKTAVKNNDGEKRSSYPALERLTVSDSREPSSNRNSGYNF